MLAFVALLITLLSLFEHGFALSHHRGHHRRLTNAQRFARGLPPAPPKRYFGSRSESARRSSVSAIPGSFVQGIIQFTSGPNMYYIGPSGVVTAITGSAIPIGYTEPASSSTPVLLQLLDGSGNPLTYSLSFGSGTPITLTVGSSDSVVLSSTQSITPVGSAPVEDVDGNYLETTIFMIDPTTGDVTASWYNPGVTPQPAIDIVLATDTDSLYMGSGNDFVTANSLNDVDSITFVQT